MTIIEEFAALVGWRVDDRELDENERNVRRTERTYSSFNRVLGVVSATLSGVLLTSLNKTTTEMDQLAKSVGVGTDTIAAIAQQTELAGFGFENIIDLAEELNNKLGESKGVEEMTAVKEATKILGLSFEDLKKQTPEDQFLAVLNAAKGLEDQQLAVSAADILLGAEANRVVGVLRQQEGSIEDLVSAFQELNFLTEEGRQGATEYTKETNKLTSSMGGLLRQIAGLLGKAITPLIEKFNDFLAANKEIINSKINAFMENLGRTVRLVTVALGVLLALRVAAILVSIVSAIGLLITAFRALGITAVLTQLLVMALPILALAAFALLIAIIEDLWVAFNDGKSVLGPVIDSFLEGVSSMVASFAEFFTEMADDIVKTFDNVVSSVLEALDSIASGFSDLFNLPGELFDAFTALDFGGIFSDLLPEWAVNLIGTESDQAVNVPSGALLPAGGLTSNMSTSSATSATVVEAPISIFQQPGEDGEALAARVSQTLGLQVANATRQMNNGVER